MGTGIAMMDLHYGHLAVDSHEHAVSLLDALALERAFACSTWCTRLVPAACCLFAKRTTCDGSACGYVPPIGSLRMRTLPGSRRRPRPARGRARSQAVGEQERRLLFGRLALA